MKIGLQKINKFYESKSILITGDRGFLGSALYKRLCSMNCKVHAFDGDVSLRKDWQENLKCKPDLIFHLAAVEHGAAKDPYDDLYINGLSALHLLECCLESAQSPEIIFASSSNIFGAARNLPVAEGHKDSPVSLWSLHKLLAEKYLKIYHKTHGIKSICLRLSNIYGPSTSKELTNRMSLNKMIVMAAEEGKLTLFNNLSCKRDWLYIDDAVEAFVMSALVEKKKPYTFLVGSDDSQTIESVANIIKETTKKLCDKKVVISKNYDKLPPMAMRKYEPNCTLFKNAASWVPTYGIAEGIEKTVEYINDNKP